MSHSPPSLSPFKSVSGVKRIAKACLYSWQGLRDALSNEAAFRQELLLVLLLAPWSYVLSKNLLEMTLLLCLLVLILVVELINSALEALADAITIEHHPLLGKAKDFGSAAVFMTISMVLIVWAVFTIRYFYY